MNKKLLIIYPSKGINSPFWIIDPENGELLETHFCSNEGFAKCDLHDNRPERLKKWKEKYGKETEAKYIKDTQYTIDELIIKNAELLYCKERIEDLEKEREELNKIKENYPDDFFC